MRSRNTITAFGSVDDPSAEDSRGLAKEKVTEKFWPKCNKKFGSLSAEEMLLKMVWGTVL